jgi:hypothetical protein
VRPWFDLYMVDLKSYRDELFKLSAGYFWLLLAQGR